MSYPSKPSKQYIMHGSLATGERYHPDLHKIARTKNFDLAIDQRNMDLENRRKFYDQEEINKWKSEIKPATCSICFDNITNNDISSNNCLECNNGHKFHPRHEDMPIVNDKCPECRNNRLMHAETIYDTHSGGKRIKTNKIRTNKRSKIRKTNKRRTNKRRRTKTQRRRK